MIHIKKIESLEKLSTFKQRYISKTTAPLDGMWLLGFVPLASHFGFYKDEKLIGYCCLNDEGYLLQFYLCRHFQDYSSELFESLFRSDNGTTGQINGAFVSTAEPQYLSHCLDTFSSFTVHTLMFQINKHPRIYEEHDPELPLSLVISDQLEEIVDFAEESIGAPKEWLMEYYSNLINRREVFGYWQNNILLALGESRGFDEHQKEYADLGVIVSKSQRHQGVATKVLKQLIIRAEKKGLQPICSTEKANVAAQKAIRRAGFYSGNRIIQFD